MLDTALQARYCREVPTIKRLETKERMPKWHR